MPRPLKVDRPRQCQVYLPESIHSKVQTELYSELEGRVPHGAFTGLITELVTAWLKSRGVIV